MTKEEYDRLPRFSKEEQLYEHNHQFYEGEIFEVHTLHKEIAYFKIITNFYDKVLKLHECDSDGVLINKKQGAMEAEINNVETLIDVDKLWRIYRASPLRNLK